MGLGQHWNSELGQGRVGGAPFLHVALNPLGLLGPNSTGRLARSFLAICLATPQVLTQGRQGPFPHFLQIKQLRVRQALSSISCVTLGKRSHILMLYFLASLVAQVRNPPAMQETWV